MDAALEVAVATKDSGDDQIVFLDGFRDGLRERATIPDTVVDRKRSGDEGMMVVHGQIEYCLLTHWSPFHHTESERW